MGVALLRPAPAAGGRPRPRAAGSAVGPAPAGGTGANALIPPAWSRTWAGRGQALLGIWLVLHLYVLRLAGAVASRRDAAAGWRLGDVLAAAPRLAPHGLVLGLVAAAVAAGGFGPPEGGFSTAMTTEEGHLSTHARFVLGPRAAEIQVRDALVRPALASTALAPGRLRADVTTYTVQRGDTIWDIGARFNVGMYSVLWSNGLDEDAILRPGQELRIPPVAGTLHVVDGGDSLDSIAKKYNVDPAAVVDFNGLRPGEGLTPDKVLVIPGGELPVARKPVVPAPAQDVLPPILRPPVPALPGRPAPALPVPVPAPPPAPVVPTGRLVWPTRGTITTFFSGWHPGIDIAGALGTPIGAADGGTVTFTGWDSTGYGYRVVVSHGNGYSTTYNHLAVISVRAGQPVGKGQTVGRMGSTGRSTGSHLHFEILRDGRFVNPLGVLS